MVIPVFGKNLRSCRFFGWFGLVFRFRLRPGFFGSEELGELVVLRFSFWNMLVVNL